MRHADHEGGDHDERRQDRRDRPQPVDRAGLERDRSRQRQDDALAVGAPRQDAAEERLAPILRVRDGELAGRVAQLPDEAQAAAASSARGQVRGDARSPAAGQLLVGVATQLLEIRMTPDPDHASLRSLSLSCLTARWSRVFDPSTPIPSMSLIS